MGEQYGGELIKNLENYDDFRNKVFPCLEGKDIDGKSSQVLIDFIVEGSKKKETFQHLFWLHQLMCDFRLRNLRSFDNCLVNQIKEEN